MNRLIVIAVLGFLAWHSYVKYQQASHAEQVAFEDIPDISMPAFLPPMQQDAVSTNQFRCDGRTYCSQMRSCAEAKYFLNNCPDVKMDGDNDGVPCEKQWCK